MIDADGDGVPSPGDTLRYTNVITNDGNGTALGVTFSDNPDSHTALLVGSVTTTQGNVLKGNSMGDESVEVFLGDMGGHSQATVIFDAIIDNPLNVRRIANQATVEGSDFPVTKSDDPNTPQLNDPTVTQLNVPMTVGGIVIFPVDSPDSSSPPYAFINGCVIVGLVISGLGWRIVRRQWFRRCN